MFRVSLCARFQADPRKVHLSVIKGTFRYLKGTTNLGLCYKRREKFKFREVVMQIIQETSYKGRVQVEDVTSWEVI